jgi:UDP-glucose 4-epimerase
LRGHPDLVTWREFAGVVGTASTGALLVRFLLRARAIGAVAESAARLRGRAAILNRERVREMMQRRWVCDPSLALRELALQPVYPLPRGVAETAAWYRKEGWL